VPELSGDAGWLPTKERMRWAGKTRQMLGDPEADFAIID
jgi:hypothetical protein